MRYTSVRILPVSLLHNNENPYVRCFTIQEKNWMLVNLG